MSTLILELIGLQLLQNDDDTYLHSFGVEYIPKEISTLISNKNIKNKYF